jgi:WhiB family redox-sensing transcriptional regulator
VIDVRDPIARLLAESLAAQAWMSRAACVDVDPGLFFPARGQSCGPAKAICGGCEVRADCLEYALTVGERFGIWGGTSEHERMRLRRGRAA